MNNATTPITGQESMWGSAKGYLTPREILLINSSPLLASELNDYQNSVNNGTAQPITEDEDGTYSLQTVNTGSARQIQLGIDIIQATDETFVGDLSYELGHFENFSHDSNLYNDSVGSLDPLSPGYHEISGMVGTITESESEANNYVVQQQILENTSSQPGGPITITLNGDHNSGGALQSTLDQAHAADKANGIDSQQDITWLTQAASNVTGSIPVLMENGAPINFYDYYKEHAAGLNSFFNPNSTSPSDSAQSGVQGTQSADANGLTFDYPSSTDAIPGSATLGFGSGGSETLDFNGGHLSSATNTSASGSVVSTTSYAYSANGSETSELRKH